MLKKIIIGVIVVLGLAILLFGKRTASYAYEPLIETKVIQVEVKLTTYELKHLVEHTALEYGVSAQTMKYIISCESQWNPDIQSNLFYSERQINKHPSWGEVGSRERSFGLVQIHLPSHPTISEEQALDPQFSIDFLAKNIKAGNLSWWTCSKG